MSLSAKAFQVRINKPEIADDWAQAYLTPLEVKILFDIRKQEGSWQAVETMLMSSGDYLWEFLQQLPEDQIEEYFQLAAIAHGCPVTVTLYNDSERNKLEIIWSYLTKNRVYRTIKKIARKQNPKLLASWTMREPQKLTSGDWVQNIQRPVIVGKEIPFQGVEKVEVYWVCQMLRVLEALRIEVGKPLVELSDEEHELLNEGNKFLIRKIREVVRDSKDSFSLAENVFFEVLSFLRGIGLDMNKVVTILWRGFDPKGSLQETGAHERIKGFWDKILDQPAMLQDPIRSVFKKKCAEVFAREA